MKNIRKYFIGGVIGIFVIIGLVFWYNSRINAAEQRGEERRQQQHQVALDAANKKTAELEKKLVQKNTELDLALQAKNQNITGTKETVRTVVRTVVQNNPVYQQCEVDQEVIEQLNQLRRLTRE